MRTIRALAAALLLVGVLPRVGSAQLGRSFKDAWFWGVKAGTMDYNKALISSGAIQTHQQAPLVGAEWLITRSHGGLYISYSQAFLTDQARVQTDASDTTTIRDVTLKNMRRLDVAAMAFPGNNAFFHPYGGAGFSVKQINRADILNPTTDDVAAQSFITQLRTGVSPYFVVGSQFRLPMFSFFVQGTASPAQKNMFLYNSKSFHVTLETGVRYNFGSSIDKY
jgi:hypothetical protein